MYEYAMTLQDFKNAQILCSRRSKKSRLLFLLWLRVLPVVGILSLLALIWDIKLRHFGFTSAVGGILVGLAWFGLSIPAMRPFYIRSLYRQMKNVWPEGSPIEIGIEGDELISRVPGMSEGRFRRQAIVDFVEDDETALLYVAKKAFLFLPKRALPQVAIQEIKAWLQLSMGSPS